MHFKQIRNEFAVSETVGVVLLLVVVTIGISIVLVMGMHTITDAKEDAIYSGTEQAFTVADSRLSKARFSTSIFQEAPFELRDATIVINDSWDNSHIIVYDVNNSRELYNGTMGTIKCIVGDREVAYQDGGVWVLYPGNGSTMISHPDFDYNGVTLTLPIMQIKGHESLASSGNSRVTLDINSGDPRLVYPKAGFEGNPIQSGYAINLSIKSDYYTAWADYINQRTRAEAVVDAPNKTINISLKTGVPLQTGLAASGFTTKSMDTTADAPIMQFELNLVLRNSGNDYTITYGVPDSTGVEADPQLLMTVSRTKGGGNKDYAYIEYVYTDGTLTEAFSTTIPFQRKSDDSMDLDMISHEIIMDYDGSTPTKTWGEDLGVTDYISWKPEYDNSADINAGDTKTLHDVTEHYLWLMAKKDQQNHDKYEGPFYDIQGKQKYDGGQSTFRLAYLSSQDIKYLYITEGVLETKLNM